MYLAWRPKFTPSGRVSWALQLGTSVPFLCRSEMKRWMTSLAPNRRTKFVSFTSRLLGESLTWKGGSRLALTRTYWASASGFLGNWWEGTSAPQKSILVPSLVPLYTGWLRKKWKFHSKTQVAESWTQTLVFFWVFQLCITHRDSKGTYTYVVVSAV